MQSLNSPSMGQGNTPSAGGADIEPQEAAYNVPSAGGGDYGAPTPHAAAVSQDPYMAPEADLAQNANSGWPMTQGSHEWTSTPGESSEAPEIHPGGFNEVS
jgi:hypothetical protein